jgi:hypothetical protein
MFHMSSTALLDEPRCSRAVEGLVARAASGPAMSLGDLSRKKRKEPKVDPESSRPRNFSRVM